VRDVFLLLEGIFSGRSRPLSTPNALRGSARALKRTRHAPGAELVGKPAGGGLHQLARLCSTWSDMRQIGPEMPERADHVAGEIWYTGYGDAPHFALNSAVVERASRCALISAISPQPARIDL